ncbi:histidine--tRNA ligase [Patescibacteria group bacterium]
MADQKKIEAKLLKGFRDYLPQEMVARQEMLDTIRKTFELYGFLPLQTPALEYADVLLGKYGEEGDKLLYRFNDQGKRDVALRYDLTVPLARVIAQYKQQFPLPFKRYQIAPVWRAEKPQKGRFREFVQCDVDIVGTKDISSDIELVSLAVNVLENLGLKFQLRVSDRRILTGVLTKAGVSEEKQTAAIQTIDKYEKIGESGVQAELEKKGFDKNQISELTNFLQISGSNDAILKTLTKYVEDSDQALEAINRFTEIFAELKTAGVDTKQIKLDPTLARGMDYYTGIIFEAVLIKPTGYGSVLGGGRYDELIGMFTGQDLPASGFSIGIDRLFDAVNTDTAKSQNIQALVLFLDKDDRAHYSKLLNELRSAGVRTDFYLKDSDKIGKQLTYAEKIGAQYAIFLGEEEIKAKTINVRDMQTGKSKSLKVKEFIKKIK